MMNRVMASAALLALSACGGMDPMGHEADDPVGETTQAITSFFGTGEGGAPACTTPRVTGPYWNNGRVFMQAAGSCIALTGVARLRVPFSPLVYGPYSLSFDISGTAIKTTTIGNTVFPAGTCRLVEVQNPDGSVSNLATLCR